MISALKILSMIWPFIREMFFGNKSAQEIIRDNKLRVLVLIVLSASLMMNYIVVERTVVISKKYIALEKQYKLATASGKTSDVLLNKEVPRVPKKELAGDPPDTASPLPPVSRTPPKDKPPAKQHTNNNQRESAARYARLKDSLDAIKAREEHDEEFHKH